MNQLAVLSIILSCIGLAVCFGGESYSEILKGASNPRAKRQATLSESLQCTAKVTELQCTTGFNMGLIDASTQCGRNDLATVVAHQCAKNGPMGELCATLVAENVNSLLTVVASCKADIPIGVTTCSAACSTALEMLQSNLGCCVNSIFNVTVEGGFSSPSAFAPVGVYFRSSFWERCAVVRTPKCPNVPSFTPSTRDTPCTDREATVAVTAYRCTQANSQPVLDAINSDSNCQSFTTVLVDECGQPSNVDYCSVNALLDPRPDLLTTVFSSCLGFFTNQSTCPGSSCTTAIEQFRDNWGCCVNEIYNTSFRAGLGASLPTDIALWDVCGMSSPGFCTSTLMFGSASTDKAFGVMLIAIAAAVVKFIF